MNYPCSMIQDLLPLYLDSVCSEESKQAVEQHLSECADCKEFYAVMREADGVEIHTCNADCERRKAASFQAVKKKIFRKQILVAVATVVVLVAMAVTAVGILKNATQVVEHEETISVSMVDGDLIGRLQGSEQTQIRIKRVANVANGQEKVYLFFCVSDTKWNALTTSSEMFSEYTLCSADKGAEQIDAVYYFTGDYTGIETMSSEELQKVIDTSKLLWRK